jgi:hypothetical protein
MEKLPSHMGKYMKRGRENRGKCKKKKKEWGKKR